MVGGILLMMGGCRIDALDMLCIWGWRLGWVYTNSTQCFF